MTKDNSSGYKFSEVTVNLIDKKCNNNKLVNSQDAHSDHEQAATLNTHQLADARRRKIIKLIKGSTLIAATAAVHFFTTGLSFSIGVYYVEFLGVFNQSSGVTSWIGSLNFAALCGAGPIGSYLIKRIGCDKTIFIGGMISTLGIFSCVFAQNIYMVFISFGLITGVGFGLGFSASLSVINLYFDQWRVFAMGFSLCGIGLGTLVHPFLVTYLISVYSWRGSLLITTSLTMHVCLAGMIIGLVTDRSDFNTDIENHDPGVNDEEDKLERKCSNLMTEECSNIKSIWLIAKYWALHGNCLLYCFGQSVVYTHIASFASSVGFTTNECSSFISILGVANLFGRSALGLLAQHSFISSRVNSLFILCYMTSGVWTIFYCLWHTYFMMAVNMALLGISMAAFGPLLSEVVCRTVGVNKFAEGYGFLMVSMAIGTLLGAPSAGWLYDITNKYIYSFYLGGASFVLSGMIMIIPSIYEKIKEAKGTQKKFLVQNLTQSTLKRSLKDIPIYGSQQMSRLRDIPIYGSQPLVF